MRFSSVPNHQLITQGFQSVYSNVPRGASLIHSYQRKTHKRFLIWIDSMLNFTRINREGFARLRHVSRSWFGTEWIVTSLRDTVSQHTQTSEGWRCGHMHGWLLPLYSVLGTWQVCPHPFEQHFFIPEHSVSTSQLSTQAAANPLAFSGAGQSPCFTDRTYLRNWQLVRHS